MDDRLRVTEIFHSLQGETAAVGRPAGFVRLTGCPLRCRYCDTAYAFQGGEWMTQEDIAEKLRAFGTRLVVITGGEPLAQKAVFPLMERLCDSGLEVYLETSGAMDVSPVDRRVVKILDIKTPGSGEIERNLWSNIDWLTDRDQVKLVLCNRRDYDWARSVIAEHRLSDRCEVLLSPAYGQLEPRTLAEWILADRLPARLQVQLHKFLWGDGPGH